MAEARSTGEEVALNDEDLTIEEHQLECMEILCSMQVPNLLDRLKNLCDLCHVAPTVVPGVEKDSAESYALGLVVEDRFRATLSFLVCYAPPFHASVSAMMHHEGICRGLPHLAPELLRLFWNTSPRTGGS